MLRISFLQDALQAQMVIRKMSEIMDTANKGEDTHNATGQTTDLVSDQEKTIEVKIWYPRK